MKRLTLIWVSNLYHKLSESFAANGTLRELPSACYSVWAAKYFELPCTSHPFSNPKILSNFEIFMKGNLSSDGLCCGCPSRLALKDNSNQYSDDTLVARTFWNAWIWRPWKLNETVRKCLNFRTSQSIHHMDYPRNLQEVSESFTGLSWRDFSTSSLSSKYPPMQSRDPREQAISYSSMQPFQRHSRTGFIHGT